MGFHFGLVLVFFAVGVGFVLANLLVGRLLRPKFPEPEKAMIYECGETPHGEAWFNFNPRFYVVAIVFVVFEVEIALMLPVLLVYKAWVAKGLGAIAFFEIAAFVVILAVGLVWIWVKGDLEWVRTLRGEEKSADRSAAGPGRRAA